MRKIRFRAKYLKTGEWVEGYYALLHPAIEGDHGKVVGYGESHSIFNDEPGNRSNGGYWRTVDEKTLCQYTGKTDRNGRHIFERDILKMKDKEIFRVVYWNNDRSAFFAQRTNGGDEPLALLDLKDWEVVGDLFSE